MGWYWPWFVARRIAAMIPVFLGATLLIYAMVFLLPGDPIVALGGDRPLSPGVIAQLRAQYHLDDPFWLQYLRYLGGILRGDFGRSFSGLPVSEVLAQAFPVTIRLALIALTVEAVFGIGFGVIAGLRRGGWFDATVLLVSLVIIAVQGGVKAECNAGLVLRKRLTITGSTLRVRPVAFKAAIARSLREQVWPLLESGAVKPVIHSTFAAAEAAQAHALMESNRHIGKIILTW